MLMFERPQCACCPASLAPSHSLQAIAMKVMQPTQLALTTAKNTADKDATDKDAKDTVCRERVFPPHWAGAGVSVLVCRSWMCQAQDINPA